MAALQGLRALLAANGIADEAASKVIAPCGRRKMAIISRKIWQTRLYLYPRQQAVGAQQALFLWFCSSANHAPHHCPQEYIEKYKGKSGDGYDAYRKWVLTRMKERGMFPEHTELPPINPMSEGTVGTPDLVPPGTNFRQRKRRCYADITFPAKC
jgi:arylsulfatase A-like enzyme